MLKLHRRVSCQNQFIKNEMTAWLSEVDVNVDSYIIQQDIY